MANATQLISPSSPVLVFHVKPEAQGSFSHINTQIFLRSIPTEPALPVSSAASTRMTDNELAGGGAPQTHLGFHHWHQ